MKARREAARAIRRGKVRWWLVYGPVRSGTTLMTNLVAPSTRWVVSDWGLHDALAGPRGTVPPSFDVRPAHRALLTEVLAACRTRSGGPLDLVYKQANIRRPEYDALVAVLGPPQRRIFCLRDPAGFMASAVRKFPDVSLENLRDWNYVGTAEEYDRIGGEVFLYHPEVTGAEYASFLRPLTVSADRLATVRYTGTAAPDLATAAMWAQFSRLAPVAVNTPATLVTPPGAE